MDLDFFNERNLVYFIFYDLMSEDLMKSIIILIQNDKGDKEILMRILNNLNKNKQLFGQDKSYLESLFEYIPEDKHLLESLK